MQSPEEINQSDHTLLMVISSKMDTLIDDMKELKLDVRSKVHFSDFKELKDEVEDLKKTKWLSMGAAGAISWVVAHFFK